MTQQHSQSFTLELEQQPDPNQAFFEGSRTMPRSNPTERAEVLLKETSLTAHEIAEMLGLDVYQVLGMKL